MKYAALFFFALITPFCFSQTTHNVIVHVNQPPTCHVVSTAQPTLETPDIYPNPASATLFIRAIEPGSAIEIRDAFSRPVYQELFVSQDNLTIDASAFARGVYVVITTKGKKVYTSRIVLR